MPQCVLEFLTTYKSEVADMPHESLVKTPQNDSLFTGKIDDLIAQLPSEWRDRFRAFVETREDPGGKLLAYLDEQAALPETSRGVALNVLDQAFSKSVEDLHRLGRALNTEEDKSCT